LVLDEATSALDSSTESSVMDAVESLSHKKTIILIAHRMDTIKNCDEVYSLINGNIDKETR
jgi:ABC-type bacteriocin/lantibiotic exporter with double-glycine peptidase domain